MRTHFSFTAACMTLLIGTPALAEPPSVVASIKPIHALVAGVMQGVGTPSLIVDGAGSPHTYSLRPSQAQALQDADLIFWVGPNLETFMAKPIESLAQGAKVVELIDAHDLVRIGFREGGPFEAHDHDDDDDHAHEKHEHAHGKDQHDHGKEGHAHGKDDHAHEKHDDHDHAGHARGDFDNHIWLDPENAKAIVHEIEETLAVADPTNAARYEANAEALETRIDGLSAEIRATLAPVQNRPFIVFHDAYQYMERRFGLNAAGSITVSPEVVPGAERVADIRRKVAELGATCVFSEPQFTPRLVNVVTEGTAARAGVLDPLGTSVPNGPELYFTLMRNMAESMRACLSPTG